MNHDHVSEALNYHKLNDGTAFGYSWHLIWHDEADSISARKWLVQDLLPETGMALISGQWGTYKTFIAVDLSAAVMTGTIFINKQVKRKGGIMFIACEGQDEIDIRLTAAFKKHGGVGNAPFAWVQGCPRLLDPSAGKILAAMVKHAANPAKNQSLKAQKTGALRQCGNRKKARVCMRRNCAGGTVRLVGRSASPEARLDGHFASLLVF
jgi:hypothetical protein